MSDLVFPTPGPDHLDERRRELARLCRRKELRTAVFTRQRPTHWAPTTVTNPETGLPFTESSAWEFVATCLDRGDGLEEVDLDVPKGKKGYVMIVRLADELSLYVKLQLGDGGKVIGRSFHPSDR